MGSILTWTTSLFLAGFFFTSAAWALAPEEVLVICNKNAAKSRELAAYYMEQRKIPPQNLVVLRMTDRETCTRLEYEAKAIPPIRRFLEENLSIRAMVTVFGVPLKIAGPKNTPDEIQQMARLNDQKTTIEKRLNTAAALDPSKRQALQKTLKKAKNSIKRLKINLDKNASFDSELSLI